MNRLLLIGSYIFVIALWTILLKAMWGPMDVPAHGILPTCRVVIISEFGDPRLYKTQVCSDEDLARVYGEQALREKEWIDLHDCDSDDRSDDAVKEIRYGR